MKMIKHYIELYIKSFYILEYIYLITWQTLFFVTFVFAVSGSITSFGIRYARLWFKLGNIPYVCICGVTSCTIKLLCRTTTYFICTTWTIFPAVTSSARIYAFQVLINVWDLGIYYWAGNAAKRTNCLINIFVISVDR